MEFTNYILEAAGVSDVDIMDIEVTQAMAEMAVLEAMMDCYEKQMVLLEYNEDAANEIFTEAEAFLPLINDNRETYVNEYEMSVVTDFIEEGSFFGEGNYAGWLYVNIEKDDGTTDWYGYHPTRGSFGPYKSKDQIDYMIDGKTTQHAKPISSMPDADLNAIVSANPDYLPAVVKNQPLENIPKQEKAVVVTKVLKQAAAKSKDPYKPAVLEVKPNSNRKVFTVSARRKANAGKKNKTQDGPMIPAGSTEFNNASAVGVDTYSGNIDGVANKGFGTSFKKFMSKAGSVISQLAAAIADSIFSINFDALAKKLMNKGGVPADGIPITKNELEMLRDINALPDIVHQYSANFSKDKISNQTQASVEKKIALLDSLTKKLNQFKEDDNSTEYKKERITTDELLNICKMFNKKEGDNIQKKIRIAQKEAAAWNTEYDLDAAIPVNLGKKMRKFLSDLNKKYLATAKTAKKLMNWAIDIGVAHAKRAKAEAAEAKREAKATKKNNEAFAKNNNAEDVVTVNANSESWAEEGWSMNLSEDEDFF